MMIFKSQLQVRLNFLEYIYIEKLILLFCSVAYNVISCVLKFYLDVYKQL
jgi:hypothetical protein